MGLANLSVFGPKSKQARPVCLFVLLLAPGLLAARSFPALNFNFVGPVSVHKKSKITGSISPNF